MSAADGEAALSALNWHHKGLYAATMNTAKALLSPAAAAAERAGIHRLADAIAAENKLDAAVQLYEAANPAAGTPSTPDHALFLHHFGALLAATGALDRAAPLLRTSGDAWGTILKAAGFPACAAHCRTQRWQARSQARRRASCWRPK